MTVDEILTQLQKRCPDLYDEVELLRINNARFEYLKNAFDDGSIYRLIDDWKWDRLGKEAELLDADLDEFLDENMKVQA